MAATTLDSKVLTQRHVAVYARDARWGRAMANSLEKAGNSHSSAANPVEIRRLLLSQRFDVLTLKVRDEPDARELAQALEGVVMPVHSVLVGDASALPLILRPRHGGTFCYVPGSLLARDVTRLIDATISPGLGENRDAENDAGSQIEEVDLEETIKSAVSAVYSQAKRRPHRFSTVVEGPAAYILADRTKLRRTLVALLRLIAALAPRGALVSVEARAGRDECVIRIRAAAGDGRRRVPAQLADALLGETQTLTAAARDVHVQGGLLWVELLGPAALALCLRLPRAPAAEQSVSA